MFPRKIILKTCGTTTLLHALEGLLAHARACGLDEVVHVSYSRKNFLKPDRQLHPHGSFDHETAVLSAAFPHGRAHILGSIKDDHWCLYLAESPRKATCPRPLPSAPDHTLEVRGIGAKGGGGRGQGQGPRGMGDRDSQSCCLCGFLNNARRFSCTSSRQRRCVPSTVARTLSRASTHPR